MSKILVTGCAGFVGSWICDKVLASGHEVIGIDNLSSDVNYTPVGVEFYQKDVCDDIKDILQKADVIVHASARAELRHNWDSFSQREILVHNNENATRNILELMPDVPLIFLSSGSVYGSKSNKGIIDRPLIETDANPEDVESPYAASKLACEAYVAAWCYKKQVPWYCLRLVNQVGARGHRGVIIDFARMVKEKNHIHASDNGMQKKNWVSVEDTAEVVVRLLDNANPVPSGIYNITSTERWSWRDIVDIMRATNEKPFTLTYEDKLAGAIGDPINLHVSGEKLNPYHVCNHSVEKAVKDALRFINWGK